MIRRLAACLISGSASLVAAEPFSLVFPVDCTLGETCHIQHYLDHDPGPGARDYTCEGLSYDGHQGTDIALPSIADMSAGVTVRAAAPGVVRGLRDGVADRLYDGQDLSGQDCGNGIAITHAEGWETQYCHLRNGSVAVTPGQQVAAGTPLGEVGLSGRTQFPHLHLTLRRDGEVIDPFAPEGAGTCDSAATLWQDTPAYRPGGLLSVGFAQRVPSLAEITEGSADDAPPRRDTALVGFGQVFGARAGDSLRIVIEGPSGRVIGHDAPIDRPQAVLFRAAGRKAQPGGWPAGSYRLSVTLLRDGQSLETRSTALRLD
ncbi:M23 family metallopeptidase [Marinovum sp.]|uniref:M23 family metallopeptidase n=1 Tax=Marinovum sp. TaxID=2024839 RepID=UPI002B272887|nr:M23 family metallopeptidase [Marinovum sp.]